MEGVVYLTLAQRLYESGAEYAEGWNFGPANGLQFFR